MPNGLLARYFHAHGVFGDLDDEAAALLRGLNGAGPAAAAGADISAGDIRHEDPCDSPHAACGDIQDIAPSGLTVVWT